MSKHRGGRSRIGRSQGFVWIVALFTMSSVAIGCARTSAPPPETAAAPPAEEQESSELTAVREEAELHFEAGERAYREGRYRDAKAQFEAALDVYLHADVPAGQEEQFQAAFNEVFSRIHVMELEELMPVSDQLVSLPDEPLPPPSEEDIEALRARLKADPLPELPRFEMPVPDPLENERVRDALVYLTTERREVIEEGLSRASRYMPMILDTLEEVGVPRELAWVPLIESLFKPNARSRAAAVGMWQFMRGTARLYGLRVDWAVDERRDPVRTTRTAAIYLKDLYAEMGDWELALAAYNAGKGRVNRAIQRAGTRDFWQLAKTRYLPRETRDHVPKIYAAIYIGTNPARYGLNVDLQEPLVYDEAIVDSITDLRVIAEAAGASLEVIGDLNPHLRMATPNVDEYVVRVPKGTKQRFETNLAAIPPDQRIQFLEHRVSRGETLSTIAQRYGTRLSAVMEMNNLRNPHRIREGQRIVIPVGAEGRFYSGQPVAGYGVGERVTYRVQRGDTLAQIARLHRTSAPDLMRWNGLSSTLIYPGDSLIIYYGVRGEAPATPVARNEPSEGSRTVYTVRRGDSFYSIAQRFDVTIDQLKAWNNRSRNTIYPGDKLVVYSETSVFDDADGPDGNAAHSVRRYTVRRGDSPYEIAGRFGVSLDSLLSANGLTRRSTIYPGQDLLIPGGGSSSETIYTVRRGDTLGRVASRHGISLDSLLTANGLTRRSTIYPGDLLTIPNR